MAANGVNIYLGKEDLAGSVRRSYHLLLFRFRLFQVLVYQLEHTLATGKNVLQTAPLVLIDFPGNFIQHQFRKADDNIKGSTKIVRLFD